MADEKINNSLFEIEFTKCTTLSLKNNLNDCQINEISHPVMWKYLHTFID
jgi:hypothetical protein